MWIASISDIKKIKHYLVNLFNKKSTVKGVEALQVVDWVLAG